MSELLSYIVHKKHHAFRKNIDWDLAGEFSARGLSPKERMTERFERLCAAQEPVFLPDEKICLMRTAVGTPDCFTQEEWDSIRREHYIHELGYISNLCPNYEDTVRSGLAARLETADEWQKRVIESVLNLADRYLAAAREHGLTEIAKVLEKVPRYGAETFREALQSFRFIHFALWLEGDYHNTVGRFDQYMLPYLLHDLREGILTTETAQELLEDFFLSFNKDSDVYVGVQQGDNGQSMVLGGKTASGEDGFNLLSEMCLKASEHNLLIDPKINLRVSRDTPIEVFEKGSRLTRAGLGFPQYSNDDVVIPGLIRLGYAPEDAVNYVVAACWEFIIPKVGCDVANIGALSFPKVVDRVVRSDFTECASFEEVMEKVRLGIVKECETIMGGVNHLWFVPSPFMSLLIDTPDLEKGAKYNNYGIHGTGLSTAADSLTAIKKLVFDEKRMTAIQMKEAVESDFEEHSEWLPVLRYEMPKMGQNQAEPDEIAVKLLGWFADALEGKKNDRGGIFRAGTGSAMYYLWHAAEIGASPDGRRKGEAFGTNFSPSLFARTHGPLSVITSFTKPPVKRAINGGPLTLEFHGGMFADESSVSKVATLVKSFITLGGHQLQLNAVNLEAMKDAQIHPENHRQLVVRIWGWSAYFVELDKAYQDHVMARQEYSV